MAISATSSSSGYKVNAIAGMNSGLDTEAIVEAMTANIQAKIDANKQDTQVLQWKQDAYRDIITDFEEFYDEYFRYSSSDKSVTNSAFFDETYCNASTSGVTVTGNTDAMDMVVVEGGSVQLATKSSITTSHQLEAGDITSSIDFTKLESIAGKSISVTYNGVTKEIFFDETEIGDFYTQGSTTAEGGRDLFNRYDDVTAKYDTADGVNAFKDYLNDKLADAFGEGAVTARFDITTAQGSVTSQGGILQQGETKTYTYLTGASLTFDVADDAQLQISSNDSGVFGADGIFSGIKSGASNKVDTSTMTVSDFNGLTPDENGNYTLSINGKDFSFAADTTLREVMSEVNKSDAGVRMNFSSVTGTFSMMSTDTGSDSAIQLSGDLATAIFGSEDEISHNIGKDFQANMSFDGGITFTTVTRSDNNFTIDGANYNFTGVGDGSNITFQGGTDVDALVDKVKGFVEAYNEIMKTLNTAINTNKYGESLGSGEKYLPLTEAQKEEMSEDEIKKWEEKAKTGLLSRDSTLQSIANRLRSAMTSIVDGQGLYQYGIDSKSWSDKGILTIDEEKLRAQIEKAPDKVANLFTGENGIATKVKDVVTYAVKGTGNSKGALVDIAGTDSKAADTTSQIAKRIASLKEALSKLETKLDTKKEYWWNKFTYLESYISQMNSQSSFLSSFGG